MTPETAEMAPVTDRPALTPPRQIRLADGAQIRIRALHADDRGRLAAFYELLSDRSKYQRFFAMPARLPQSRADTLLDVDGDRRVGVVAEPRADPLRPVALAQYWMSPHGTSAELGFVVDDVWQARGLGRALFAEIVAAAAARGVSSFVAHVHWDNLRVLKTLDHETKIMSRSTEGGVVTVVFSTRYG
jgi:GNAT superfamily N-acetyltransferase